MVDNKVPVLHSVWRDQRGSGLYRVHDLTNEFGEPELQMRISCTGSDDRRWSLTLSEWHAAMVPADLPNSPPPYDTTPSDEQRSVA